MNKYATKENIYAYICDRLTMKKRKFMNYKLIFIQN